MTTARFLHCGLFAGTLACATFFTGCDRAVVETTKTHSGPDGTTVDKEKTVQHSDGTVTVDKESKTTTPPN